MNERGCITPLSTIFGITELTELWSIFQLRCLTQIEEIFGSAALILICLIKMYHFTSLTLKSEKLVTTGGVFQSKYERWLSLPFRAINTHTWFPPRLWPSRSPREVLSGSSNFCLVLGRKTRAEPQRGQPRSGWWMQTGGTLLRCLSNLRTGGEKKGKKQLF